MIWLPKNWTFQFNHDLLESVYKACQLWLFVLSMQIFRTATWQITAECVGQHRKFHLWVWGEASVAHNFCFCGAMKCILGHKKREVGNYRNFAHKLLGELMTGWGSWPKYCGIRPIRPRESSLMLASQDRQLYACKFQMMQGSWSASLQS